ncbi:MAG: hypothetical protein COB62_01630 [Piscirickettsiaceae bacterium]|nr:MAG: hypothetical protein COB62_01630 [Piscirickettsiaceae bacterium]
MNDLDELYSTARLRYKCIESECIVYNLDTAETLLLERQAAVILQAVPNNPTTLAGLKNSVVASCGSSVDESSLAETLEHLVLAGLVNKTI